jgi:mono/diheme cytochrome c family protein
MRSFVLISVLLFGCSKSAPDPQAPETGASGNAAVTAQIDQGKQLYGEHCAKCHGDAGQGVPDKGPPVVGKEAFPQQPRPGAKRTVEFRTAADVFAWATVHMPGDAPGTLSQDQYLAIFAFDLTANGIKLEKPLDGPTAQSIVLHP